MDPRSHGDKFARPLCGLMSAASRASSVTYIIPPIPPIPPMPPPISGMAGASFLGASTMAASVVRISEATEAASISAVRTTLTGSMIPFLTISPYLSFCAS